MSQSDVASKNQGTTLTPVRNAYELMRQRKIQENLVEFQKHGLDLNLTMTDPDSVSPSPKKKKQKKLKSPAQDTNFVRRSSRRRREIDFFMQEDYSREGVQERRARDFQKSKSLSVSMQVLDRYLIDKLAAEAYVRTTKLATVEAQKLQIDNSSQVFEDEETGKKRKRQHLRKIHKAVDLYSKIWVPKGARVKLSWTVDYVRQEEKSDKTNSVEIDSDFIKIKEERKEFAEENYHERYLASHADRANSAYKLPLSGGCETETVDMTTNCPTAVFDDMTTQSKPVSGSLPTSETGELETETTGGEEKNTHFSKKSSILHQKDFYASIIQEASGTKQEHCYSILEDLETKANHEENDAAFLSLRSGRERILYTKENAEVELTELTDQSGIDIEEDKQPRHRLQGHLYWTVPLDLRPGTYYIEIGSHEFGQRAVTEMFCVTEAFGVVDNTTVGTWCICGETKRADTDENMSWICCETCLSWHHWSCYAFAPKIDLSKEEVKALKAAKSRFVVAQSQLNRAVAERQKKEYRFGKTAKTNREETVLKLIMHDIFESIDAQLVEAEMLEKFIECERDLQVLEELDRMNSLHYEELQIIGHDKRQNTIEELTTFHCWMCHNYTSLENVKHSLKPELELLKLYRLISMIKKASGGYSRRTMETSEGRKHLNVYSTPNAVVCYLGTLLRKYYDSDFTYIDLGAGEGRLGYILPPGSLAVEISHTRYLIGREKTPNLKWLNEDALTIGFCEKHANSFDFVISNPDFEVALPFIVVGFFLLRKSNPEARLYFILPSDFFEASALRSRIYKLLPFKIEKEYKLGHLNYLDSDPKSQKLGVDSLFVLKIGRDDKYEHVTVNSRLAGML